MRRFAALSGALVMVAGASAVAAPVASEPSGRLTVVAIGRDGARGQAGVAAYNLATKGSYYFSARTPQVLPRGTYNLVADVFTPGDTTDTLLAARVHLDGATRVVLDARHGHRVSATLHPGAPSGYEQRFSASLCAGDATARVGASVARGQLYVVPTHIAGVELAWSTSWQPTAPGSRDPRYLAATTHRDGLPTHLSRTFEESTLASVRVTARSGPEVGDALSELRAATPSVDACAAPVYQLRVGTNLPYRYTAHIPDASWKIDLIAHDYLVGKPHHYRAGRHYKVSLDRAVWGPNSRLPYVRGGRLYLTTTRMFVDPVLSSGAAARTVYRLSQHGSTLLTRTSQPSDSALRARITHAGWFTLTESATRQAALAKLPAGTLSTVAELRLHFRADPAASYAVRGYVTRFAPSGLDGRNQVAAGSHTTVELQPVRSSSARLPSDVVKSISAWTSTDGGRHWRATHVRHVHGRWTISVTAQKAGTVSLRALVTDTHGSTARTSVLDAYGVR